MTLTVGVDEAGRGCIVGSLYVAGLLIDGTTALEGLKSLGVHDSKLLSRKRREAIFPELIKNYKYSVKAVSPSEIDKYVGKKNMNLNWLESRYFAEIIDELAPQKAIIDCPDIDPSRFERTIRGLLHVEVPDIVAEYHADFNYPVVGAASILAKVTRDKALDKLKEKYGDMGSGYPSDPKTQTFFKKWLVEHGGEKPNGWVRKSWSSWQRWDEDLSNEKLI